MKALNISTHQWVNPHQHWLSEAMSSSGCGWVAKKGRIQRQGASENSDVLVGTMRVTHFRE